MFQINLPPYATNLSEQHGRTQIFDVLRKRYVSLTPEEWVRQHFVHYLTAHKGYPAALMANEVTLALNGVQRRCDSVVFRNDGTPLMILEYKAPMVRITEKTFQQISTYNMVLRVAYLVVSNGMEHFCCEVDYEHHGVNFLPSIPAYSELHGR